MAKKVKKLTPEQRVLAWAKKSSIKAVREGVKSIEGIKELPTQVVNEWFSEITNKLLAQHYVSQLDMSGVLSKLAPFRSPESWKNGQLEVIAQDVKATTDYAKDIVFEDLFNSEDRDNSVAFFADNKKKSSRVKEDISVITRAKASAGNFVDFVKDISAKLQQDLDYQFDLDQRATFVETLLPALMISIEIDTSAITDNQEKFNLINKTLMNLSKKFVYPTTTYNQAGYVASTITKNQVVMWNDDVKTEIDSDVLAPTFNKELKETGIQQEGFQFADGIYFALTDRRFINWDITLNESGTVKLDEFQVSYAKRLWYGIDYVPFYNNVIVTEKEIIEPLRTAAKKSLDEKIKDEKTSKEDVKFYKQLLKRLKMVEKFEKKFRADIDKSIEIKSIKTPTPPTETETSQETETETETETE